MRPLKKQIDAILRDMDGVFAQAYQKIGRPSVPPERLLKAMLLLALYSVRSERQLCERIDTDLLFREFLDMSPEEPAFDPTVLTHNRPRLDEFGLTGMFFEAVVTRAKNAGLCSDDHFSVDGTLIESYASMKSFRPQDEPRDQDKDDGKPHDPGDANSYKSRNPDIDFHGQKRSNATHASRTDPEARLYRKGSGQPSQLAHLGHILSENRNGLILGICVTEANGTPERVAALTMLQAYKQKHGRGPKTVGVDAGFDSGDFLMDLEAENIVPHITMRKPDPVEPAKSPKANRDKIEARLRMQERLASDGYRISQKVRKKVEECFGWAKTIAGVNRSRWVGRWKLKQDFELSASMYNLLRVIKLQPTAA